VTYFSFKAARKTLGSQLGSWTGKLRQLQVSRPRRRSRHRPPTARHHQGAWRGRHLGCRWPFPAQDASLGMIYGLLDTRLQERVDPLRKQILLDFAARMTVCSESQDIPLFELLHDADEQRPSAMSATSSSSLSPMGIRMSRRPSGIFSGASCSAA